MRICNNIEEKLKENDPAEFIYHFASKNIEMPDDAYVMWKKRMKRKNIIGWKTYRICNTYAEWIFLSIASK